MAVIKGCAAFHPFLATLPRARTQGRWRRRAASHEALVREDSAPVGRRKTLGAWEGRTLVQRAVPRTKWRRAGAGGWVLDWGFGESLEFQQLEISQALSLNFSGKENMQIC